MVRLSLEDILRGTTRTDIFLASGLLPTYTDASSRRLLVVLAVLVEETTAEFVPKSANDEDADGRTGTICWLLMSKLTPSMGITAANGADVAVVRAPVAATGTRRLEDMVLGTMIREFLKEPYYAVRRRV